MANLRQTILIRQDLGFSTGLMAAQVAHIHMQLLRGYILRCSGNKKLIEQAELQADFKNPKETEDYLEWLKASYIFVHGVPNKEVLEHYVKDARLSDIPVATWADTVYIDVAPEITLPFKDILVGASLGPCDSDLIKSIIGKLPLLTK